ncbi:MAG: 30S ribosomal protein S6 [Cyanobacteria bacterium J06639_1]
MPRPYETMLIVRPDVSEEPLGQLVEAQKTILQDNGAQELEVLVRGKKRFQGCEIKRFRDGIYIQFNYDSEPTTVKAWEKTLRLNESVLRFVTFRIDE